MSNDKAGFDCEFVEKPPKVIQSECPVCLLVLREPYQVDCCGNAFCQGCIDKVKADNKPCPCCKKAFVEFKDKRLKKSLYKLQVYCSNKNQGCQWVGELEELDNHLNSNPTKDKQLEGCRFAQIQCLYCSELFQRLTIGAHQSDQCLKRPFSCEYCKNFDSCYEDVTVKHWSDCGSYPVPCPNQCGDTLQRHNVNKHITDECILTNTGCDFQHFGCEVRIPRQLMPLHLQESMINHMLLQAAHSKQVEAKVIQLEEENKQLKQQVARLTQDLGAQQICTPICPVEFTITNFNQMRKNDEKWESPPFYTCVKGYKANLGIDANGQHSGKGTHLSTYVTLMRGEFDNKLKWPFRGSLKIELLNQDNGNEHSITIPFDSEASGNRVKEGEEFTLMVGWDEFIAQSSLQQGYLKNDCLKFRVSTE